VKNEKMNGKKTLPLIVITSMLLSLLPSVMFANALVLSPPDLWAEDGVTPKTTGTKGEWVILTGTDLEIPAGTTVSLYWDDSTIAWNGVKGLLNSTTAAANGNYEVWFKVPEAKEGLHYLWIKTTAGGIADVVSAAFTVLPKVSTSSSSGLVGDTIVVTANGYTASADITVYFEGVGYVKASAGTGATNSLGTATVSFKVPTGALYGAATITVTDEEAVTATKAFTIGPTITLSQTSGSVGSVITITGR